MSIDRYPGPRSFESNEQAIFWGRTSEIENLLDLIRLEQVLVLFSKSGLGKSSLLNAGVGPALPAFNYQPIRVRFQIFATQSVSTTDATDTTPLNSTIEYITNEYSAAYHVLQKHLDTWQQEMAQLPNDNGEQQSKQQAELERVIQQQLESLSAEQPLTDERLAEFKQKQYEITDRPLTDINRRVWLNNKIETAKAALSLTTLSLTDKQETNYSPRTTVDPFGQKAGGRLWETLKLHPFPNGGAPVFFFDQFEEFFAASPDAQRDFLTQLAEVLSDQPPRRISERIAQELSSAGPGQNASPSQRNDVDKARIAELTAWGRQPAVKCVFAIRDDRLAEIDRLESFIPLVLKNRYKLNPLNSNNARLAIVEPAAAIGDFTTPRFSYADMNVPNDESTNTLQLIIKGLRNDNDEIDSTQLQMVCNNIERAVEEARRENPEKVTFQGPDAEPSLRVDKRLIPNEQTIKTFFNEFYTIRLNTVGTSADVDLAGSVIENYFVLSGTRIGVDEPKLKQHLLGNKLLINKLVQSRLIRPEQTSRGIGYELSHDKLIEPVEQAKKVRDKKEQGKIQRKKERLWTVGIIFFLVSAFGLISYYYSMQNKFKSLYANAITIRAKQHYDLGRYGVAYRMWIDEEDSTDKLNEKLLFAPFAGQKVVYDDQQQYVAVQYKNDSVSVFERAKDLTYHRIILSAITQKPTRLVIKGHRMALADEKDTVKRLQIIDLPTRRVIFSATSKGLFKPATVVLSPKGNYILLTDTTNIPRLFKLSPKDSFEDHQFNMMGLKTSSERFPSTMNFLPNETGCYFRAEQKQKESFPMYISNFKWDTTLNVVEVEISLTGKKTLLWTKKGKFSYPLILDLITKKSISLVPIMLNINTKKTNGFVDTRLESNFFNDDSILIIQYGTYDYVSSTETYNNLLAYYSSTDKITSQLKPFRKMDGIFSQFDDPFSNNFSYNPESYIVKSSTDTDTSNLFIFNVKNNIIRKFPFKKKNFEWLCNEGNYVIVQTNNDKKVWLFNVSSGKQVQVGTVSSNETPTYKLYISPDKKTVKLIAQSVKNISIITILENGINYADKGTLPVDAYADKGRGFVAIKILDGMLQVKLMDESIILLFLEGHKNYFPYLAQKFYSPLSAAERVQYGLGEK